jgi:hypothetical protein
MHLSNVWEYPALYALTKSRDVQARRISTYVALVLFYMEFLPKSGVYYGYVMLDYIYLPVTTALRRSIKVFSYFYNIVQSTVLYGVSPQIGCREEDEPNASVCTIL